VYRVRVTERELATVELTRGGGRDGFGVLTLTVSRGRWTLSQREPGAKVEYGTYSGTLDRMAWTNTGPPDSQTRGRRLVMRVSVGDGWLRFRLLGRSRERDPLINLWFEAHPWRKIG
jgi:hypothetical protein